MKEKWSRKVLISWFSGENSLFNRENDRRNLLHLLSKSINELLKWDICLGIRLLRAKQCLVWSLDLSELMIDLIMWFDGSKYPLRWNLLYSFFRWRWIRIKPEIALMPAVSEV